MRKINMKATGIHLFATILVAAGVAFVAFMYWFPPGLVELAGGRKLFGLLVAGLVVCGPLLTALLYRTEKSRSALLVDVSLIGLLQGAALLYGLNALVQARPLALVFETDRFRLVTYADIPVQALPSLEDWIRPWCLDGFVMASARSAQSEEERAQRFDDMLSDISPSQRPVYWQDLARSAEQIRGRARSLSDLRDAYPAQQSAIDQAIRNDDLLRPAGPIAKRQEYIWLPLVSRNSLEWIVFLDPFTMQAKAFLPLDGFI